MGNINEIFATEDSDVGSNDHPNLINKDESELVEKTSCSSSTSDAEDEETKSKELDDTNHIILQPTNNSPTESVSSKEYDDKMNLDTETDGGPCVERNPEPENMIQPCIHRINRVLDEITNMEELNSGKNKIRRVLDDIVSEFMSLSSKRDILQSEVDTLRNDSKTIQAHSTLPSHLPPPPPPPPPLPPSPQISLKSSRAVTNNSLGSMLEEAKRKLSTGENIEVNADSKTDGLKIDEKKDL